MIVAPFVVGRLFPVEDDDGGGVVVVAIIAAWVAGIVHRKGWRQGLAIIAVYAVFRAIAAAVASLA